MSAAVAATTAPLASLWIVRHGERVDETPDAFKWRAATPKSRQFDPPLTEAGRSQSQEAVAVLRGQGFDRIYASPCARTLATAQEISSGLGGLPVTVVPALAECAAVVKKRGLDRLDFLSTTDQSTMCPAIDSVAEGAPKTFEGACDWLASQSEKVLVVSHREGIRDLAHERLKLPYCAIANFEGAATASGPVDWVLKKLMAPSGHVLLARS